MKTLGQILNHDFKKCPLSLYDKNGREVYYERFDGTFVVRSYDPETKMYTDVDSNGFWVKQILDENGDLKYYEAKNGVQLCDN